MVAPVCRRPPGVQLGVCGNGVGVLGAGTTASCSGSQSSGGNSGGGNRGGGNSGDGSNGGSSDGSAGLGVSAVDAVATLATPAAALGMLLGANTLAFTGGDTLLLALAGLALAGIGPDCCNSGASGTSGECRGRRGTGVTHADARVRRPQAP